jgi:hypothetical protein
MNQTLVKLGIIDIKISFLPEILLLFPLWSTPSLKFLVKALNLKDPPEAGLCRNCVTALRAAYSFEDIRHTKVLF